MIPPDTIQLIKESSRIEEVVGDFVSLKKRGANMFGLCPFHNEKTPSFTVSPAKGIFKCFGCGKAGDSVSFVMDHEHYTYPEALKYLAKKYNIEVEEKEQTAEEIKAQNEREALFSVSEYANSFFRTQLTETDLGKSVGMSYFLNRGIREDTIKAFQLGFSPDNRDAFSRKAMSDGYKEEYLVQSGLSIKPDSGKIFDRFRGRVIFPIHNLSGKTIGFGGRILTSKKEIAKYLNSPESDIYNKSKVLYGMYQAKGSIIQQDECYLVEGYTDVLSLYQSGIANVVASSGTSLTTEQIRLIRRFTSNITMLYDGDPAGVKASFRGINMILEEGMNVRVVLFPDGEDPDSFARNNRSKEVKEYIQGKAQDFIRFKTQTLSADIKNDPLKKAEMVRDIVESIAVIPDGIKRSVFVQECSNMLGVPEQTLMNEVNKILRKKYEKNIRKESGIDVSSYSETTYQDTQQEVDEDISCRDQERDILRLLFTYGEDTFVAPANDEEGNLIDWEFMAGEYILIDLGSEENPFTDPLFSVILEEAKEYYDEHAKIPPISDYIHHQNKEIAKLVIDFIESPYMLSENWSKRDIYVTEEKEKLKESVLKALNSFKARKLDVRIKKLKEKLKEVEAEDAVIILKEIVELENERNEFNNEMGRVITR